MADVLRASVELPTVVFTAILGIAGCLWLLSLLGFLDIEIDAAEGLTDGLADGLADGPLESLELTDVPATLLLTIFGLGGWFVSVLASIFLLDSRGGLWSLAVGFLAALAAMLLVTAIAPRLARIFVTQNAPSKRDLLGRIAEVRSATVTETAGRGEATWPDGTVSTVDLRTIVGGGIAPGDVTRGDRVLLVDWDEDNDNFFVGAIPAELAD